MLGRTRECVGGLIVHRAREREWTSDLKAAPLTPRAEMEGGKGRKDGRREAVTNSQIVPSNIPLFPSLDQFPPSFLLRPLLFLVAKQGGVSSFPLSLPLTPLAPPPPKTERDPRGQSHFVSVAVAPSNLVRGGFLRSLLRVVRSGMNK